MVALPIQQLYQTETPQPSSEEESAPEETAVHSLLAGAKLPKRLAQGVQAWCLCRGGALAATARGSDPEALAKMLLGSTEKMIAELGLRLVEARRLEQALLAAARAGNVSVLPKELDDEALTHERAPFGDAVERLFDAAKLPRGLTYGARAWCSGRGGTTAAVARGSDPQAFAGALLQAPGHLVEEMIPELGLKLVEARRLRQALCAALRGCGGTATATVTLTAQQPQQLQEVVTAPITTEEVLGSVAVLGPATITMTVASKKRLAAGEELEEEVKRLCKVRKGPGLAQTSG
jgi:hypothetical protein